MRLALQVTIGGEPFEVRELTTGEIRSLIAAPRDDVGTLLIEGVSLAEIAASLARPVDALDALTPSVLERLAGHVREVNPGFFAMKARVDEAVRRLQGAPVPGQPAAMPNSPSATASNSSATLPA